MRFIAATGNENLEEAMAKGRFPTILLYRLNGFTVRLPPLRERTNDVPLLAEHFLRSCNRELGGTFTRRLRKPWNCWKLTTGPAMFANCSASFATRSFTRRVGCDHSRVFARTPPCRSSFFPPFAERYRLG